MKSDLLRDLDKQKYILKKYHDNVMIDQDVLNKVMSQLDQCFVSLNEQTGKAGHNITHNDWLQNIHSRIGMPGGTCEFDLPSYYAWQNQAATTRQADLQQWCSTLVPLADALQALLQLWRDSGTSQTVIAHEGKFQQRLPQGRPVLFVRVGLARSQEIIPEIIGNHLAVMVRLTRYGADHRLIPVTEDVWFDLSVCL